MGRLVEPWGKADRMKSCRDSLRTAAVCFIGLSCQWVFLYNRKFQLNISFLVVPYFGEADPLISAISAFLLH